MRLFRFIKRLKKEHNKHHLWASWWDIIKLAWLKSKKLETPEVGDKLESRCPQCNAQEIWKVKNITKKKYSDGMIKTYELEAVKNCVFPGARRSIREERIGVIPDLGYYKLIK